MVTSTTTTLPPPSASATRSVRRRGAATCPLGVLAGVQVAVHGKLGPLPRRRRLRPATRKQSRDKRVLAQYPPSRASAVAKGGPGLLQGTLQDDFGRWRGWTSPPVCPRCRTARCRVVGEGALLPARGRSWMVRHGQDVKSHRPVVVLTMCPLGRSPADRSGGRDCDCEAV